LPYLPWAKIKGTYYYWDAKVGPDIKGNVLGVDIEITPSVSFEFGQENNILVLRRDFYQAILCLCQVR
jgi:hypothetical protein